MITLRPGAVRACRAKAALSQGTLAENTNLSAVHVWRLDTGRVLRVWPATFDRLVAALGCNPGDLAADGPPHP